MQKTKEIQADGLYIFSGRSNANSCFIEKLSHGKQFMIYANYYLKGYLSIKDYVINKDGWTMIVKIGSKKILADRITKQNKEVWKIISERMRLFLSTFVRVTNKEKSRTGCLVHSSYERMYFESMSEAKLLMQRIRNQQLKIYSGKKKYRAIKMHYRISGTTGNGSIFLCSKNMKKKGDSQRNLGKVFDYTRLNDLVVQEIVEFTKNTHLNLISSHFHSKSPQ